ncbi:hypothetical protein CAPTEDRAFT_220576 [Capitella teleta]|uniref:CHHC U11-48K-type domain-containing protein n=1 Tax=Capitella teleta TaxID=283909 RepID=R7TET6_CAPTE|nr:hypothetical protein CAPTEDRAFT_220576 [Capitella teleta]|eukprot:ELT91997.1 hypothetical protein CAPTEDRAFT_220576 [Capitella teleta]
MAAYPDDQVDLTNFIRKTEEWIDGVLDTLGWTKDHILEKPDLVPCPVDNAHKMPVSSLGQHLQICPAKKKGYSEEELREDQSSKFFYEKSNTVMSIDLDDETLLRIISSSHVFGIPVTLDDLPLTVYRSLFMLSQSQRLAIYEHCLSVAKSAQQQTSIPLEHLEFLQDNHDEKMQKSLWELKAEERDQKRRRQSYKGKSVSTKSKSHLQIIQEVINNQTELLAQKWKQEKKEKRKEEKRKEKELDEESRKNGNSRHRNDSEERHSKHKHKKHKKHKHKEKSKHRSRSRSKERSEKSDRSGRKRSKSRERSCDRSRR